MNERHQLHSLYQTCTDLQTGAVLVATENSFLRRLWLDSDAWKEIEDNSSKVVEVAYTVAG